MAGPLAGPQRPYPKSPFLLEVAANPVQLPQIRGAGHHALREPHTPGGTP